MHITCDIKIVHNSSISKNAAEFLSINIIFRSVDYRWQRGGNASNTCTVLSLLKQPCEILARFGGDFMGHKSFLRDDLRKYKIDHFHCPTCSLSSDSPVSTIILSLSTGSRTIIHHKANLSDLMLSDFEALSLPKYSWIHFEVLLLKFRKQILRRDTKPFSQYFLLLGEKLRPSVAYDTEYTEL